MSIQERKPTGLPAADTALAGRSKRGTAWHSATRSLLTGGVVALLLALILLSLSDASNTAAVTGGAPVLILAIPAFLAGMLSFLSPCCLPVLSAYFAYTFQASRERIVLMTVMFFLGLATTLVVLGASATALSQVLFRYLPTLTLIGGLLVIGFGIMSILGKGFGGVQLLDRPTASVFGSYLYGATFALGWTACVGPILGALLTMLATQGLAVLQGAVLSFIYALGLGMPLILLASYFSRLDKNARVWRLLRGRGFSVNLGVTTLHLHTTSIASGVLLIAMGLLLATGQLAALSRMALRSPLTQWVLSLDGEIQRIFLGR